VLLLSLAAATGGSQKAPLILTVFYLVPLLWLLDLLVSRARQFIQGFSSWKPMRYFVGGIIGLTALTALAQPLKLNLLAYRGMAASYFNVMGVENFLRQFDPTLLPGNIYTDSLMLYFPGWPLYSPHGASSGWGSWIWGSSRFDIKLDKTSYQAFLKSARQEGIRILVLDNYSYLDAGFINEIFEGKLEGANAPTLLATIGVFKIFQLPD
jgi:hypothetical protein